MTTEQVVALLVGLVQTILLASLGSLQWTLRSMRKTLSEVTLQMTALKTWQHEHVRDNDRHHNDDQTQFRDLWAAHEDLRRRHERDQSRNDDR